MGKKTDPYRQRNPPARASPIPPRLVGRIWISPRWWRPYSRCMNAQPGCLDRRYTGRYLGLCRQVFDVYPAIRKSRISESAWRRLPANFVMSTDALADQRSLISEFAIDTKDSMARLSFTCLIDLIAIADPERVSQVGWAAPPVLRYATHRHHGSSAVRFHRETIGTLYRRPMDSASFHRKSRPGAFSRPR